VNTTITHVVIHGRVQGVGYRAFVEHEAGRLALQGFVRNRRDGTVEALFAGSAEAVRIMIDLCRKGPPGARVDRIDQSEGSELSLRGEGEPFAVLPTA
jgi:acylphosphatase